MKFRPLRFIRSRMYLASCDGLEVGSHTLGATRHRALRNLDRRNNMGCRPLRSIDRTVFSPSPEASSPSCINCDAASPSSSVLCVRRLSDIFSECGSSSSSSSSVFSLDRSSRRSPFRLPIWGSQCILVLKGLQIKWGRWGSRIRRRARST